MNSSDSTTDIDELEDTYRDPNISSLEFDLFEDRLGKGGKRADLYDSRAIRLCYFRESPHREFRPFYIGAESVPLLVSFIGERMKAEAGS